MAKVLVDSLKATLGSGVRHIEQSAAAFPARSCHGRGESGRPEAGKLRRSHSLFALELNIKCSKGGGAKLKGPSPGAAKWRINEVGKKKKKKEE